MPRITQRQNYRNNHPAKDVYEYWKVSLVIPFLDSIITSIGIRFSEANNPSFALTKLHPLHMLQMSSPELFDTAKTICEFYGLDITPELDLWRNLWEKEYQDKDLKDLTVVNVLRQADEFFPKTELRYCVACGESITDKYLLQVSDKAWHAQCLRCCICQLVLDRQPSCFIKDESVYCKQDYAKSFGAKCSKCCRGIASSDWVRKARDHVYHLACFACEACKRQLSTGEEFALHEERVLCKTHYLELVDGASSSSDDGADSESSHSKSKAKRVRTTFTEEQLQVLQANFQLDSNPDGQDLERIAQITGLSKRVTQVWFQNSRARQKKHLHTGKMKSSQNIHSTSPGQSNDSGYGRHINLHLTYSFQQQHKTSPVYIPHHQAMSETSSIDDLSEDSMMLCSMRGEGSV